MNEKEIIKQLDNGKIEEVKTEENLLPTSDEVRTSEIEEYLIPLEAIKRIKREESSVPSYPPKNFIDQIYLYVSGSTYRMYMYIKDAWKKVYDSVEYTDLTDGGATTLHTHAAAAPLAHKTSHQNGGTDEISVAGLSGLLADGQTPLAHKTSHQDGGSDEISVAGLSGVLADTQKASVARGQAVVANGNDLTLTCGFQPSIIQIVAVGHRTTGGGSMSFGTGSGISTEGCLWSEINDGGDSRYDGSNIIALYTADGGTAFAIGDLKTIGATSFTIQWTVWTGVSQVVINWIAWG